MTRPAPDALPAGDPGKPWWTFADLAVVFGVGEDTMRKARLPEFNKAGFPQPLPWSLREKRWRPAHVLAWREAREREQGCEGRTGGRLRAVPAAA